MKQFFRNLSRTVPPRARIMIFTTMIIVMGTGYYMYTFFVGETARRPEAEGTVDLSTISPKETDIGKPKPGDDAIIPNDSPLAKTASAIEETKANDAASGKGSYIQSLRLNKAPDLANGSASNPENTPNEEGIESILAKRQIDNENRRTATMATVSSQTQAEAEAKRNEALNLFITQEIEKAGSSLASLETYMSSVVSEKPRPLVVNSHGGKGETVVNEEKTAGLAQSNGILGKNSIATRSGGQTDIPSVTNNSAQANSSTQLEASPVKTSRVTAGTKYYAILHEGVDSDEPSYVTATIIQEGPLKGAKLLGLPSLVGEKVQLNFSVLTLNNTDMAVSAVGFDPDADRPLLADDVDRHTFERYFKLGLSSFVDGYAETLVETDTINAGGFSQTTRRAVPEPRDRIKVAAGKVGETLSPTFAAEFNRPPTVLVNGQRAIGVMFVTGFDISSN